MSDTAAAPSPTYARPATDAKPVVRRSFVRQVIHDTFGIRTARFGFIWIASLAVLGILAPFIASSHPIVMRHNGTWSSPMWQFLSPVDLILVSALLAFVITLVLRQLSVADAFLATLATVVTVSPAATLFKSTPESVDFQRYRDMERVAANDPNSDLLIVRTLIPFSPTDRLRDMPYRRLTSPGAQTGVLTLEKLSPINNRPELAQGEIRRDRDGNYIVLEAMRPTTQPATAVKSVAIDPFGSRHWLGTETDGADLLSRMIHATRVALSVGIISTGIALTIGILVGGLMGYYVGWVDLIGMRLVEIFEATPRLLVLITVMAAYAEYKSIYLMMVVIGFLGWTGTARFIRGEFLKLRKQDFVQAAIAVGLPMRTVIYRHILPNALTPVLVTATFSIAGAIETEAILNFLGLGIPDTPSWGQMLNQARSGGQGFVWWMAIFPGLAIFLTVFAYALIGDAMRDALDPKLRKRE